MTPGFEERFRLSPEQARWRCPPERFSFGSTADVEPVKGIIGQSRALKALELGMEITSPGYNVFVCGIQGTGRLTTVRKLLKEIQPSCPDIKDYCFVHNFRSPARPVLVTLPRGGGRRFQRDVDKLIRLVEEKIPAALENDDFLAARREVIEAHQKEENDLLASFKAGLEAEGLVLVQVKIGPAVQNEIMIKTEGDPIPVERLEELVAAGRFPADKAEEFRKKAAAAGEKLEGVMREARKIARKLIEEVTALKARTGARLIEGYVEDLVEQFQNGRVTRFLRDMKDDILENLDFFSSGEDFGDTGAREGQKSREAFLRKYAVNVVLDNSEVRDCPIVIEQAPGYINLFGAIGVERDGGVHRSDHTTIQGGSLLRANGGYIVFNALDALSEPGVWKALKRTLRTKELVIQNFDTFTQTSPDAIKPEPIPLDVKVIMIGDTVTFHSLYAVDEDFQKVFKVKADFRKSLPLKDENIDLYAAFLRMLSVEEGILPFDPSGVAGVVEYGVRRAGHRSRVSAQFSEIADLAREASFWAGKEGLETVGASHVDKAIEEMRFRNSLPEERVREMIDNGILLLDTEGKRTGQVNGLTIYDLGNYSFGTPARITAAVSVGKSGIINIEREAKMSGRIHDKGVLILTGFLRERFARERPLTLSASICFEQSYGGVDGDSASSTEIYALLSALSGLPLRQDIAVTGSVNQKGDIQPIGGVNEKIEGFFDVCSRRGLTGKQGVIMPIQNVGDLMLREEVLAAMREGRFHVYALSRIEEGIEILTGTPAGKRDESGRFPPGTVFALVEETLARFKEFYDGEEGDSGPGDEEGPGEGESGDGAKEGRDGEGEGDEENEENEENAAGGKPL